MEIKYKKPLIVASFIDLLLGGFLILCGILEFAGVLKTPANNSISTLGIQLSYFVFISGILVFISGLSTFLDRKRFNRINMNIFVGLLALAFPIFISVVLLLQAVICIRLVPTILSSLFYIISILIVKLANEEMRKTHKLNTQKLTIGERRKNSVNVASFFKTGNRSRAKSTNISSLGKMAAVSNKKHSNPMAKLQRALRGKGRRLRTGSGLSRRLYSGSRRKRKF